MKIVMVLLLAIVVASAEIKTYTKTVRQTFGGAQSADDARLSAIKKAEADIAREAGEYISTTTVIKNSHITQDEITAVSASIIKLKVLSEKPYTEGSSFGLEISVQASLDTDTLDAQIDKILKSRENLETIKELQKQNQELLAKLNQLEIQNKTAQTDEQKKRLKEDYATAQNKATAIEWFNQGYEEAMAGQWDEAKEAFNKSIELAPKLAQTYYNWGIAQYNLEGLSKAITVLHEVVKGELKDAAAYTTRGNEYRSRGELGKAIDDYTKAIEIDPYLAKAYYNRGVAYAKQKNYKLATQDARKSCELGECWLIKALNEKGVVID